MITFAVQLGIVAFVGYGISFNVAEETAATRPAVIAAASTASTNRS
jgi:hypothetical protein